MECRRLGRSDIEVSALCLGTMTWGVQNGQTEAYAQMDYALDSGINFFDTEEMYPAKQSAKTYGRTEEIIGATSLEHLKVAIAAANAALPLALLREIEEIHNIYTYPCP